MKCTKKYGGSAKFLMTKHQGSIIVIFGKYGHSGWESLLSSTDCTGCLAISEENCGNDHLPQSDLQLHSSRCDNGAYPPPDGTAMDKPGSVVVGDYN